MKSIQDLRPDSVVLVSTRSAPKIQKGYPFLRLLYSLRAAGYESHWFTSSAKSSGLPHDAHYSLVVSSRTGGIEPRVRAIAASVGTNLGDSYSEVGPLDAELDSRKPRLGASRRLLTALPSAGVLKSGVLRATKNTFRDPAISGQLLRLPTSSVPGAHNLYPRPVRLVSRHGKAGLAFKRDGASFALGPGTSASPLFAFETAQIEERDVLQLAPYSNWLSVRDDYVIVRLTPSRAVLLHGPDAQPWEGPVGKVKSSLASQYNLISTGFPPQMLRQIARGLSESGKDLK